ncbi:MAG TPA: hypothetical protein IAC04_06920 [Candidatus Coprenecus stercoravium]|uniref:C4-type zinc ribbon domain-containing protein n=1 Tax=Candidatus Coprenecus stercoravium TaxID=2840735 RepID=A0A9D2GRA4_9BACT|nr:hypothetical protein [Candidatus Coprenecus stercoravium]
MATTKQKNVIDTPIDRRETFVSLSKSISDSDAGMEHKLHTLYMIQQKDSKIDEIHMLLGELPDEIRDLEDEIAGLKTRVGKLREEITDAEKFVAQKKIEAENSKAAIAKYQEQQANVKNNREYVSISRELEYQQLELELADKRINEKRAAVDGLKASIAATQNAISQKEADLEEKKKESDSITEETAKEEERLTREIAELKASIDARTLAAYEKVRANARNGLAVVTVKRDACGGCFNKIPPQKQLDIAMNKKIIVCEYCGRILVSPDFEEDKESKTRE